MSSCILTTRPKPATSCRWRRSRLRAMRMNSGARHHPIQSVNLSFGHGSVTREVSGSGGFRASDTASHPSGRGIERSGPLRATEQNMPHASQAQPRSLRPPQLHWGALGDTVRYRSRCFAAAFLSLRSFFSFTDSLGLLVPVRLFCSLFAITHILGSWFGLSPVVRLGRLDRVLSLSLVAITAPRFVQRGASIVQHGNR
jgi:hypothetical protein